MSSVLACLPVPTHRSPESLVDAVGNLFSLWLTLLIFLGKHELALHVQGLLPTEQPHEVKNRLTHNKVQTANALTVWRTQTGAGTSASGFPIWVTSGFLETLTVQTTESTACGVSEPPFQSTDFRFTKLSLSTAQWKCFFYLSD